MKGERRMEINTSTQDYIRGKIVEVPNYEEWMSSHAFAENQPGEFMCWSDKLASTFEQIKTSMYLEELPVTNISFTNKGRLDFSYYHHTEDRLYPLGSVFTQCELELLEQLPKEQLKCMIDDELVSSRSFAMEKSNHSK